MSLLYYRPGITKDLHCWRFFYKVEGAKNFARSVFQQNEIISLCKLRNKNFVCNSFILRLKITERKTIFLYNIKVIANNFFMDKNKNCKEPTLMNHIPRYKLQHKYDVDKTINALSDSLWRQPLHVHPLKHYQFNFTSPFILWLWKDSFTLCSI